MLAVITLSRSTIEPCAISGTFQSIGMLSTRCASATPATDSAQAIRGLTHRRSRRRFIKNCIRAGRIVVVLNSFVKTCHGKLPRQCRAMIKTTIFQYGVLMRHGVLTCHPGSAILARC